MKRTIYPFGMTTIFAIISIFAIAQKKDDKLKLDEFDQKGNDFTTAKTTTEIDNPNTVLYKISIKAPQDFVKTYPRITGEKWEILKDGYVVSFVVDSIWIKNYYDKKGRWLHCIAQYKEAKLPRDVRAAVKSIYYDFSITVINEVNTKKNNKEPVYFVHLQSGDIFKIIKVSEGALEDVTLTKNSID
ncbi:hypothetical protein [Segetibacter aerophilus]|uniref:Uncharacterized protein n=1 Tax=Segetibacter aerophilus TaxID=670293 RepID=A0A512BJZ5_9BACT|nr:hypothetical protein [Segetibacter aerophilus]GEO12300.1 hypothetical protein SAE01_47960 [Segetibacter aerophilus]